MVFKLRNSVTMQQQKFENDVKMYGIQTINTSNILYFLFENDVKMYGIQTVIPID